MPAPKRNEAPSRTKINRPAPSLDGGRYSPKRCVGDTVKVITPGGKREFEIVKLATIHDPGE